MLCRDRVFQGPASALGLAFYNSIAVLGGFAGPYLTGNLLQRHNGLWTVCIITGVLLMAAAGAVLALRHLTLRRERLQAAQCLPVKADAAVEATAVTDAKDIEAAPAALRDPQK